MFQFTTTHVINSNYDATSGTPLWSADEQTKAVNVKGVNNFVPECVTKIYKAEYTEGKPAEVEVDFSSAQIEEGDILRLIMYIRLTQSSNLSYYANDTQFKGKPFSIEFPVLATTTETLKNLKKIVNKYGVFTVDKPLVTLVPNGNKLTIKATDEFQRFTELKFEKFQNPTTPYGDEYLPVKGITTNVVSAGKESFGDYDYIMRNIKLPTTENTHPFAPKSNEYPIPGAKYNQYTIHYCVERGPLGLNAVGDTVKSTTTHVFFVNTALLSEDMSAKVFATKADGTEILVGAKDLDTALKDLATKSGNFKADDWKVGPKEQRTEDSSVSTSGLNN